MRSRFSSRNPDGNFRRQFDASASGVPAAGKELVRAYCASRDGERIDPRRDPAYHNQILFAGSRR